MTARRTQWISAAIAISLALSACTGSPSLTTCPAEIVPTPTDLAPGQAAGAGHLLTWVVPEEWLGAGLDQVVAAFQKLNPDLTVELIPVGAGARLQTTEAMLQNQGGTPDVVTIEDVDTALLAEAGLLEPLWNVFTFDQKQDWLYNSRQAGSFGHEQYSAPLVTLTQVLYLNVDLLGRVGVAPPAPAERWSWERIAAIAQKAAHDADQDGTHQTWSFAWEDTSLRALAPLVESLGGRIPKDRGAPDSHAVGSAAWARVLTFYQNMHTQWGASPRDPSFDAPRAFADGRLAMFVGSTRWILAFENGTMRVSNFRWSVGRFPVFRGHDPVLPRGGWHLAVSARASQKDGATRLVVWLTNAQGARLFWEAVGAGMPVEKTLLAAMETSDSIIVPSLRFQALAAEEAAHEEVPIAVSTGSPGIAAILEDAFRRVRAGEPVGATVRNAEGCLRAQPESVPVDD